MYLIYKNNHINFNLNFQNKLNLIIGDSSTGKTTIVEEMGKHQNLIRTDAERIFFNPVEDVIDMIINKFIKGRFMLIIDSDEYSTSSVIDKITSIPDDTDICIIVMGRKFSRRLPVAIRNVYKLVVVQGVTKNVRVCEKDTFSNIIQFRTIKTEDSKSGYLFFKNIFKNVETVNTSSNVIRSLTDDSIVVFDGLGYGAYIESFLNYIKSNPNVGYICWNSFESFILATVFDDSEVVDAINTEDKALQRLHKYNSQYSKTYGCTEKACNHCNLKCKQSSRKCLQKSEYASLLVHEIKDSTFSSAISKMSN